MMLSLLALAAIPTTTGVATGTTQGQRDTQGGAKDRKGRECAITVFSNKPDKARRALNGKTLVLREQKLYASIPNTMTGHAFSGFFVDYPSESPSLGLVSMTSVAPPSMGWIFVDKDTLEVKYGNRTASIDHVFGPWDWTADEVGIMLEGHERFVAIEESPGCWAIYFDRAGNGQGLPPEAAPICLERWVKGAGSCEINPP